MSHVGLSVFILLFLQTFIVINIVLMLFNLFPLPPLDGGHVAEMLLPWHLRDQFRRLAPMGLLIVLGLLWFTPLFGLIINGFLAGMAWLLQLGFGTEFVRYMGMAHYLGLPM